MNIFKSLLFLEGYLLDPSLADDEYGPTYGARADAERRFTSFKPRAGHAAGPRREPAAALRTCDVGGCG